MTAANFDVRCDNCDYETTFQLIASHVDSKPHFQNETYTETAVRLRARQAQPVSRNLLAGKMALEERAFFGRLFRVASGRPDGSGRTAVLRAHADTASTATLAMPGDLSVSRPYHEAGEIEEDQRDDNGPDLDLTPRARATNCTQSE